MELRVLICGIFLLGVYIVGTEAKQIGNDLNKIENVAKFKNPDKCQQPLEVGPCHAAWPKWYYDTTHKQCRRFQYGGCQGNDNRFDSEEACRSECVATVVPVAAPVAAITTPDKCQQPLQVGPCHSAWPKWYYDTTHKQCRRFKYGGCHGNENRFDSEEACRNECVATVVPVPIPIAAKTIPDKCQLPKVVGPCHAALPKWYYDNTQKKCLKFKYGGCRGNENRFNSEEDCRNECASVPPGPEEIRV